MVSSVTINGKEYIQSKVLASKTAYSFDYIGRLAREEKVLATKISGVWFVEPGSLDTYVKESSVKQEIRKEELRQQRKIEHVAFKTNDVQVGVPVRVSEADEALSHTVLPKNSLAIAQSFIILLLGIFVGSLGWVAYSNDVDMQDFANASRADVAFIAGSLTPSSLDISIHNPNVSFTAASVASIVQRNESLATDSTTGVYTTLPQFPSRVDQSTSSENITLATSTIIGLGDGKLPLSDEVVITTDQNGEKVVTPVFKYSSSSDEYFLLVPVNDHKK